MPVGIFFYEKYMFRGEKLEKCMSWLNESF